MSKGTAFTRVLSYFRDADVLEAEACLSSATRIVADRKRTPAPAPKRARPAKRVAQGANGGQETLANA